MDKETILFLTSVIACLIGVFTFISAMMQRSKNDGVLANKVDNALKGIDEIKATLNEQRDSTEDLRAIVVKHEEQLTTLFRRVGTLEDKRKD